MTQQQLTDAQVVLMQNEIEGLEGQLHLLNLPEGFTLPQNGLQQEFISANGLSDTVNAASNSRKGFPLSKNNNAFTVVSEKQNFPNTKVPAHSEKEIRDADSMISSFDEQEISAMEKNSDVVNGNDVVVPENLLEDGVHITSATVVNSNGSVQDYAAQQATSALNIIQIPPMGNNAAISTPSAPSAPPTAAAPNNKPTTQPVTAPNKTTQPPGSALALAQQVNDGNTAAAGNGGGAAGGATTAAKTDPAKPADGPAGASGSTSSSDSKSGSSSSAAAKPKEIVVVNAGSGSGDGADITKTLNDIVHNDTAPGFPGTARKDLQPEEQDLWDKAMNDTSRITCIFGGFLFVYNL